MWDDFVKNCTELLSSVIINDMQHTARNWRVDLWYQKYFSRNKEHLPLQIKKWKEKRFYYVVFMKSVKDTLYIICSTNAQLPIYENPGAAYVLNLGKVVSKSNVGPFVLQTGVQLCTLLRVFNYKTV